MSHKLSVMILTEPTSNMLSRADRTHSTSVKNTGVITLAVRKFKIIQSIVVSNVVSMMDYLCGEKIASKVLLHHEPVFSNITVRVAVGVARYFNQNVPTFRIALATIPTRVPLHHLRLLVASITLARSRTTPHFGRASVSNFLATFNTGFDNHTISIQGGF